MYFKFFDLGDGLWVKLGLTAKVGDRFVTGLKCWVQENGRPMPLLLNTVVTNSDAKITSIDGSPSRLFLKEGDIKGFSDIKEILVIFKRNGHVQIFHARWDKEECENGRTLFKFKAWEERPREKSRPPFNETMADAVKEALNFTPIRGNGNGHNKPPREEKSREFKQVRQNPKEPKKSFKQFLEEIEA